MEIKRINAANPDIVKEIVLIHLAVLTESFLNNFGEKFLRIIYTNLINSLETICLALYEDREIRGFALATTDYSVFFSRAMGKHRFTLAYLIFIGLISKPVNIYKLLVSLPALVFSKETPHPELQFLGVSPEFQGRGLGSALMEKLREEFKRENVFEFYVGTKAEDPLSNKFYQKLGFTKKYTKKYFDKELNYYISPTL